MLNNVEFPKTRSYKAGLEHEPIKFYLDCLFNSKKLDLLLGYFSSSAINTLSVGFAKFIYSGGSVRIVANHILSKEDKMTILQANNSNIQVPLDLTDITDIKSKLDEYGIHFFKCIAYLISVKRIEIKIIKPLNNKGIAHYKSGIFYDGFDKVSFDASCNFTAYGLMENAESLKCNLSTDGQLSFLKIQEDEEYFEKIFNGEAHHLQYLSPEDIEVAIKQEFGDPNLNELLIEEKELLEKRRKAYSGNKKYSKLFESMEMEIEQIANEPRFPFTEERDIQKNAYKAWVQNSCNGIFAMATGSGKTVTALNCLLKQYKEYGIYKAIIVVPTQALALQWEDEVKSFNFQNIVSTHTEKEWRPILNRYTTRSILKQDLNLILITTYSTFNRTDIQSFIKKTKGIESFIYIADEAHNIGSSSSLKNLPEKISKRIGLSATPERIYDDAGSEKLYSFFNSRPPEYTFRYTMKQAIDDKILCNYDYHPIFVQLTDIEMKEYKLLTDKLRKFIDSKTGQYKKEAEMLLLRRKHVIHKAENKKLAILNLLQELKTTKRLDYTFVFVPEGYEPDYSEKEEFDIQLEDLHIIDEYAQLFKNHGYSYHKYISGIEDPQSVLKSFAKGEIQILLAMKCLDEGVDIPRTEHAIFCSSTGNPRQFVQRRGRVLRRSKEKLKATIWDLIVVPPDISTDSSSLEKNLFTSEVKRIVNFATLADNQVEILYGELKSICEQLNIDLFDLLEEENQKYN